MRNFKADFGIEFGIDYGETVQSKKVKKPAELENADAGNSELEIKQEAWLRTHTSQQDIYDQQAFMTYPKALQRLVAYAGSRIITLQKVYRELVPIRFQTRKPARSRMVKQIYRELLIQTIGNDIEKMFVWFYARMHGGREMPPGTYMVFKRHLNEVYSILSPQPDEMEFDADLTAELSSRMKGLKTPRRSGQGYQEQPGKQS